MVVHGVQHVFHPPVRLEAWPSDDHRSRIVFITRDISRETIEAMYEAYREAAAEGVPSKCIKAQKKAAGQCPPPNSSNPPLSVFSLAVPALRDRGSYHFGSIASGVTKYSPWNWLHTPINRPVTGAVIGAVASSTLLPILKRMKHCYYWRSSHVRVQVMFLLSPHRWAGQ